MVTPSKGDPIDRTNDQRLLRGRQRGTAHKGRHARPERRGCAQIPLLYRVTIELGVMSDRATPACNVSAETGGTAVVTNGAIAGDWRTQAPTSMGSCRIIGARRYIDKVFGG